jgi:hypothetical protein
MEAPFQSTSTTTRVTVRTIMLGFGLCPKYLETTASVSVTPSKYALRGVFEGTHEFSHDQNV